MMLITGMLISGKMSVGVLDNDERAQQQNHHRENDEGVRAPKREFDYPHEEGLGSSVRSVRQKVRRSHTYSNRPYAKLDASK